MRNFTMENLHIYIFVIVGILVAVYMMATISPTTPVYGQEYTAKYIHPADKSVDSESTVTEIEIVENITEKNFSSNL